MLELTYDGSSALIVMLVFLFGLGGLATIAVVVAVISEYRGTYRGADESFNALDKAQPMWYYSEAPVYKGFARRRSLPYGAYGTDVRGKAKRRPAAHE